MKGIFINYFIFFYELGYLVPNALAPVLKKYLQLTMFRSEFKFYGNYALSS